MSHPQTTDADISKASTDCPVQELCMRGHKSSLLPTSSISPLLLNQANRLGLTHQVLLNILVCVHFQVSGLEVSLQRGKRSLPVTLAKRPAPLCTQSQLSFREASARPGQARGGGGRGGGLLAPLVTKADANRNARSTNSLKNFATQDGVPSPLWQQNKTLVRPPQGNASLPL